MDFIVSKWISTSIFFRLINLLLLIPPVCSYSKMTTTWEEINPWIYCSLRILIQLKMNRLNFSESWDVYHPHSASFSCNSGYSRHVVFTNGKNSAIGFAVHSDAFIVGVHIATVRFSTPLLVGLFRISSFRLCSETNRRIKFSRVLLLGQN